MKWHRIYAILLRFFYLTRRSIERSVGVLVGPTVDLILWGTTSAYFQKFAVENGTAGNFLAIVIGGIIFWQIIWATQIEIPFGVLEELWNRNLLNVFGTPLRFSEWLVSLTLVSLSKTIFAVGTATLLAWLLYHLNVFPSGFLLLPFLALLLFNGWWIGFFITGIILRRGTNFQSLAWSFGTLLAPFSGIYYPINLLPPWMQTVSTVLPTSYVFSGLRHVLQTGRIDINNLVIASLLTTVYLLASMIFFYRSYRARLNRGILALI